MSRFTEKTAESLYNYALNVLKCRFPEAEPIILLSSQWACKYAINIIEGRWPAAEAIIMTNPHSACWYARDIIMGSWPDAEPVILTDAYCACMYAMFILKCRWPEAENIIGTDEFVEDDYNKFVDTLRPKKTLIEDDMIKITIVDNKFYIIPIKSGEYDYIIGRIDDTNQEALLNEYPALRKAIGDM